nr:MAG TPA: hypothetical protein [Caudoviricetes sp.]
MERIKPKTSTQTNRNLLNFNSNCFFVCLVGLGNKMCF